MPWKRLFSGRFFGRRRVAWFTFAVEAAVLAAVFSLTLWAESRPMPIAPPAPTHGGFGVSQFLVAFAACSALLVLAIRSRWGSRLFTALFVLAVFTGIFVLTSGLFGYGSGLLLTAAAIVIHYAWRRVFVYDLLLILGLAGVTLSLGSSLQPLGVVIILAILAVYDIFAVYATKHMVQAAEALLRQKALFAIIIPSAWRLFGRRPDDVRPGQEFLFLGTGDVALPGLLVASAGAAGWLYALPAALGSILGLALTHYLFISQEHAKPMPALPAIAAGAIAGQLLALIIFRV